MRYDVVVVGSGFGGSVAALRLAEKGYSVLVCEAGRRFSDRDLPATSWRLRRFLWAPAFRCFGIQRITPLRNVLVLSGAGVGGGSLVYANTLCRPDRAFYDDPQWCDITDWERELAPHFDTAERMLGAVRYDRDTRADRAMRAVAERMGVGDTFHPATVAVYLGQPDEPRGGDPYFGGAGPRREPCRHCGACMTGCRYNAKNTLVKNYLYLAERLGVEIRPMTMVTAVRPGPDGDGYLVSTRRTGGRSRATVRADHVIFAAGALGTQRLLHRLRRSGDLPGLSPRLGALTRTNSESIVGARSRRGDVDFTDGVAITSAFRPDARTRVEPVRYGAGSNAMSLLQTTLTEGGAYRPTRWLLATLRHPLRAAGLLWPRRWSHRTVIALVMQSVSNSLTVGLRRSWYGRLRLTSRQGTGEPNPTWIDSAHRVAGLLAEEIDGVAAGAWGEVLGVPLTAHLIGGAVIAADAERGVVDAYHRVFGHRGLHVVDGSAIPANLGANPSLTITAQAERAFAMWPNRGEADPRPPLGAGYREVAAVPPRRPAVPATAPASLRWGSAPAAGRDAGANVDGGEADRRQAGR